GDFDLLGRVDLDELAVAVPAPLFGPRGVGVSVGERARRTDRARSRSGLKDPAQTFERRIRTRCCGQRNSLVALIAAKALYARAFEREIFRIEHLRRKDRAATA